MSRSVTLVGTDVGVKIEHGHVVAEFDNVSDAVLDMPFNDAVTTAVLFPESVPALAVNVAAD